MIGKFLLLWVPLVALGGACRQGGSVEPTEPGRMKKGAQSMSLEHLFDAELQYKSEMPLIVPIEDREGELIGSGEGTVAGEKVRGTIRWSMFAANCAYLLVRAGIEPRPEEHLCKTNPGGVIETEDGARIWFDAKGYGLRGYDETHPHRWRLTMALQFNTDDERYGWLNKTFAVWEGRFDEKKGRARYRAYALNGDPDPDFLAGR